MEVSEDLDFEDPVLKQDLNRLKNINKNYKHIACLTLVRNALNEGSDSIKRVIKNSVHDKADTFDKIMILILDGCQSKIQNEEISEVIFPNFNYFV